MATRDNTGFSPPRWLQNAHLQSVLPGLKWRYPFVARRAHGLLASAEQHIIDCGDGTRLLGLLSRQPRPIGEPARQLVVLLHGWEGSAESLYVLSLGAHLYAHGCDVMRLNFRDHGGTHALNPEIFHSCRIAEVVGAVKRIQALFPAQRMALAGFSLGGNFALRVAVRAPADGIALHRVVAVCPVLRPHSTLEVLDRGWAAYRYYFLRKWKASLRLKQQCFPELYDFADVMALNSLGQMTDLLVRRHSDFVDLDAYLNGYALTGSVFEGLKVTSHIICAADDPIIPSRDLDALYPSSYLSLTRMPRGGHCGFMDRPAAESWADRHIGRLLTQPVAR